MTPSTGALNPNWVKALIVDNGVERVAFVTLDAIGADGTVVRMGHDLALLQGFPIPFENVIFSAAHTHSGPGALSPDTLWALAPATDLLVPELQRQYAQSIATALIDAYGNIQPAKIAIGHGLLYNVTTNRRAHISPYVKKDTIDPNLAIIRVDKEDGTPLATLWNFAFHGVCYGPDNLMFSSDLMGGVCESIEEMIGGVALFMNGDAGDIDPGPGMCDNKPNFAGAPIIAKAVQGIYNKLTPTSRGVQIKSTSVVIPFGPTDLNATLGRWDNCYSGGPLDICSFCRIIGCDLNVHMYSAWIEQNPRFTGISFVINGVKTGIVTMPGEPLVELGRWVRADMASLGYDITFLAGYSNNHMGYFAPPDEYDVGGYESQLTFWGINTAIEIRKGAKLVGQAVVP